MPACADDEWAIRLVVIASALAGRAVGVLPTESGEPAWSDGQTINLDATADARTTLAALAVQASLIAAGSLEPDVVRPLARKSRAARRYLTLEGHRALAVNADLLPNALVTLMDSRIAGLTESAAHSAAIAVSKLEIGYPPEFFGTLRVKRVLASQRGAAATRDTVGHIPRRDARRDLEELDDGESTGADDGPDLLSSPVGGAGFIGTWLKRLLSSTRSGGTTGGPPGADSPTHRTNSSNVRAHAVMSAAATRTDDAGIAATGGSTYPEWDVDRRRYRADWCTVREIEARSDPAASAAIDDALALRRPLARLGMGLQRRRRQMQGDDIDVDAAVESRVAVAAGSAPDDAVYLDNLRRRRDLSVLVLLDVSGSAAEAGTLGRTVHQQQRIAAANLVVTLHDLGDRVALYGYNSQGRSAVNMVVVKRFDDHLDSRVLQRLNTIEPASFSRLGAAVRHGSAVLARSGGTSRQLLVVVSDGLAYDHGYELGYGAADARRALTEARRRGIGCVCLTVGANVDTAVLRNVFGSAAHAVVARPEGLVGSVGPMFRSALRAAEGRRCTSTRSSLGEVVR